MNYSTRRVVLALENVSLSVQDGDAQRKILDNVSLALHAGEVVGLVGPSGSGKSTLLTVAGCLREADQGTVTLYPQTDLNDPTPNHGIRLGAKGSQAAALRREHIGIVFQQPNLLPALTVKQQLLAMRRLGRVFGWPAGGRKAAEQRAQELLNAVGLRGYENRRVSTLSGGQQARVNIVRALMNNPEILLVDEPTAALDQRTAGAVTSLIMEVTRHLDLATLYITHDLRQLHGADRIVQMLDGRLDPAGVDRLAVGVH